jgi:hypothetical protein
LAFAFHSDKIMGSISKLRRVWLFSYTLYGRFVHMEKLIKFWPIKIRLSFFFLNLSANKSTHSLIARTIVGEKMWWWHHTGKWVVGQQPLGSANQNL